MREMQIPVPEGLPEALKMSADEFAAEARFLLAVKLYEFGRVSAGSAAELAGLDRMTFLASLARYGVPAINLCPGSTEAVAKLRSGRTGSDSSGALRKVTSVNLDDLDAWRVARRLSLEPIGTVGLLLAAKKRGLIVLLKAEFDRLKITANFPMRSFLN